jgi:transposase-like protein
LNAEIEKLFGRKSSTPNLQNHGIHDILIACVNRLKSFAKAVAAIFPQTEMQLYIIH